LGRLATVKSIDVALDLSEVIAVLPADTPHSLKFHASPELTARAVHFRTLDVTKTDVPARQLPISFAF